MNLLEIQDLSASYGGCRALRNVRLALREGEIAGLCGPNKAGKSTLARCLAGAKCPDSGRILLAGVDVTSLPAHRRLELGISLCPEGRGIYAGMSVHENLRIGAGALPTGEREARLGRVLEHFPILAQRLDQRAGTLSGGEAQMLGIARRLLRRPRLLIIDEPSLGLAPIAIDAMLRAVTEARREFAVTVLLIEEAPSRLSSWVDRAYVLNRGVIIGEGAIEILVRTEAVALAYLGEIGGKVLDNPCANEPGRNLS
jgi:branched-chain amino acid transport system ATP-binding protein